MATPTKLTAETITAARTFRSGLVFARLTMFQTAFIATSTITAMAASKTHPYSGIRACRKQTWQQELGIQENPESPYSTAADLYGLGSRSGAGLAALCRAGR